jgi:predicted DNA-binding protein (MmcQ/YjbR family)
MPAKPAAKAPAKPSARSATKAAAKSPASPSTKASAKPSTKASASPSTKASAKPSTKASAKPSTKASAKLPAGAAAKPGPATGGLAVAEAALRTHALGKPEATEHFPWGERAIKVKGKVFLFMYADATRLSLSTKLPDSAGVALMLPFAKPTGYGLGKAGWVSASFERSEPPPIEMLCAWIDESYQAVAPAKLASAARAAAPAAPASSRPATRVAAKR